MDTNETEHRALINVDRRVVRPPALILGIPVADLTLEDTLRAIDELVRDGRRHGRTHQVCTVNVDFLVNALRDDHIARILRHAALSLPDGMPVVWASHLLGTPVRERVAGADLVPLLVEASSSGGWHVLIFGSSPAVAGRAEALLRSLHPAARVSVQAAPVISDVYDVDEAVLDGIAAVDPDILCVALGNPKQERFIDAHRARLGVPVMIGVGGSVDMIVGEQHRAPSWMQRTGLEWLWRSGTDPRRLVPRYLRDLRVFAPALVREWRRSRRRRHGSGIVVRFSERRVEIELADARALGDAEYQEAVDLLSSGSQLRVSDRGVVPRPAALAQLVGLVAASKRGAGTEWAHRTRPRWIDEHNLPASLLAWDHGADATNPPRSEDRGGGYDARDGG
jgi:exopolysaccharide biosynthesis WecB/TagA/CpsF family protein